jgi:hypothetical protein
MADTKNSDLSTPVTEQEHVTIPVAEETSTSPSVEETLAETAVKASTEETTETKSETAEDDTVEVGEDKEEENEEDENKTLNPQDYFHAMNLNKYHLRRTNAWGVACTIDADVYAQSKKTDDPVALELIECYKTLQPSRGKVVNVLELAHRVIDLCENHYGADYVFATLRGRGFRLDKNDKVFNPRRHLTRSEGFELLETANFRLLVKAFRFFVEEACFRAWSSRVDQAEWTAESAMYRPNGNRSEPRSSMRFIEFATVLLYVHRQLSRLSDSLVEVDDAMNRVRAVSTKLREEKRIKAFERRKEREATKKSERKSTHEEDEPKPTETKKATIKAHMVPKAPKDAWKNGNPLVENPLLWEGSNESVKCTVMNGKYGPYVETLKTTEEDSRPFKVAYDGSLDLKTVTVKDVMEYVDKKVAERKERKERKSTVKVTKSADKPEEGKRVVRIAKSDKSLGKRDDDGWKTVKYNKGSRTTDKKKSGSRKPRYNRERIVRR